MKTMREEKKIVVPYLCPSGHEGSTMLTQDDLRAIVANGVLSYDCEQCGTPNEIHLTEVERDNIQRLIDRSSGEQLPEPTSPASERH
jgi:hypothetical protein